MLKTSSSASLPYVMALKYIQQLELKKYHFKVQKSGQEDGEG